MRVDAELFGDALPTYLTKFVGRVAESVELAAMLREPGLVTVCGIGGAGKTRLAVEVARETRTVGRVSRVYWVPLVAAVDPGDVVSAIVKAFGDEGSPAGNLSQLTVMLRNSRALLVLDNCEQVANACRELLGQLLPECPELRVLTTSRVPLGAASVAYESSVLDPPRGGMA